MATTNFQITDLTEGQSDKVTTINTQTQALEDAITESVTLTVTGDFTITDTDFNGNVRIDLGGTPGAPFTMALPARKKLFVVSNNSGATATIEVDPADDGADGTTVNVSTASSVLLYSDGTNVVSVGPASGGGGGSTLVDWKDSVRVATAAAGTLATDFEVGDTVDGVVLVLNDRILIKDQVTASENGIYIVQATGAPTRATDFDEDAEVTTGAATYVEEGTANGGSIQILSTTGSITVGSTNLTFSSFSGGGGAATFTGLTDTPSALTGAAGQIPVVNSGETALEFGTPVGLGQSVGATRPILFLVNTAGTTNTNGNLTIPFQQEDYDDFNMFDGGVSTTNVTIPAALNGRRVRFSAGFGTFDINGANTCLIAINRNGSSDWVGAPRVQFSPDDTSDNAGMTIMSGWVTVTAGEVYTLQFTTNGSSHDLVANRTWMCVELEETILPARPAPTAFGPTLKSRLELGSNFSTSGTTQQLIPFDTAVFDDADLFSASDNGFVIPAAYNGMRANFRAFLRATTPGTADTQIVITRTRSMVETTFAIASRDSSIIANNQSETGWIDVQTGDIFTIDYSPDSGDVIDAAQAYFTCEIEDPNASQVLNGGGTRLILAADEATADGVGETLSWTSDFNDLNAFDGGNPTRLTVPEGVTRVRVVASITYEGSTVGERVVRVFKNGGTTFPDDAVASGRTEAQNGFWTTYADSGVISVTPGDYFEVTTSQTSGGALNVDASPVTFFSMEVVGAKDTALGINDQVGTTYSPVLADAGDMIRLNNASAITVTIEPDSTTDYGVGTVLTFEQVGAGAITFAAGAGVTVNSRGELLTTAGQFAVATVIKVAANTWTLTGDMA